MTSLSASAREAALAASRLVVGSSSARMPQLRQKVSARAKRMMRHASTWSARVCLSGRRLAYEGACNNWLLFVHILGVCVRTSAQDIPSLVCGLQPAEHEMLQKLSTIELSDAEWE